MQMMLRSSSSVITSLTRVKNTMSLLSQVMIDGRGGHQRSRSGDTCGVSDEAIGKQPIIVDIRQHLESCAGRWSGLHSSSPVSSSLFFFSYVCHDFIFFLFFSSLLCSSSLSLFTFILFHIIFFYFDNSRSRVCLCISSSHHL